MPKVSQPISTICWIVCCLHCLAVKFINSRMSSHRKILITFGNRLIFFHFGRWCALYNYLSSAWWCVICVSVFVYLFVCARQFNLNVNRFGVEASHTVNVFCSLSLFLYLIYHIHSSHMTKAEISWSACENGSHVYANNR